MTTKDEIWKPWQRIGFRFFFSLVILTSSLCWHLIIFVALIGLNTSFNPVKTFKPLVGILHWLDRYIFHTGYNPKIHVSFPQDDHFAVVFYLSIFLISIIGAIVWSVLDKKSTYHNKLLYWFNLYLRYTLAIMIFSYGMAKLIPTQMPHPGIINMVQPYGEQSLFDVMWNFMGMSPGYMRLIGTSEILAALLLLFRRTYVFGCLFMLAILANVAAMNWFYNVPVKMFSAQLVVYTLFLTGPYLKKLFTFFFKGTAATISPPHYAFTTKWKRYLQTSLMIVVPLTFLALFLIGANRRYSKYATNASNEKMYDVTSFVAKDTLPPLTTDTLRWNRLMFVRGNTVVIYNMKNQTDWYQCDVDSTKKTYTFRDDPDKKKWHIFTYSCPLKGQLKLTGKWKGKDINVVMKQSSIDSIPLNREKIRLVND